MREALRRLDAATQAFRQARLPEIDASARAVAALGADAHVARPPESTRLDEARHALIAAAQTGELDRVSARHLREAPWLLWTKTAPLAHLPSLLDRIAILGGRRASVRRALVQAWLLDFARDAPRIEEGAQTIRNILADTDDLRLDAWRSADRRFDLFDVGHGPARLAQAILDGAAPVSEIVAAAGLGDPLQSGGGFARATHDALLASFAGATARGDAARIAERSLVFLAPAGALRFDDEAGRAALANGLLAPWRDGGAVSLEPARAAVQSFLLRMLGDPRIRPSNWVRVDAGAMAVMRRWIARASLKLFFDLIDEHALDHQWRYREAFWSACLESGLIDDVWPALGKRVFASARAVRGLDAAFAKLEGVSGDQSVLLMRISGLTFCDWSHNGALRAWQSDWSNAPQLGRPSYARDELVGKCLPFPPHERYGSRGAPDGKGLSHIGSDRNYWQGSVAELLARRTGIRLSAADWEPK